MTAAPPSARPRRVKAALLAFNSALPPEMRDYTRTTIDAGAISDVLVRVARERPELYAKVTKDIADIGRHGTWHQGESVFLSDFRQTFDRDAVLAKMDQEVEAAKKVAKTPEQFQRMREQIWMIYSDMIEKESMRSGLAAGNNLALTAQSGARGKADHVKMLTATPGIYRDAKGQVVPIFIRNSYGEGLRPAEYLAGTFGARLAVTATKNDTAKGGFLGKQLVQAAAPLVVTANNCKTTNGISLDTADPSLVGRVLAHDLPGTDFKAGTVVDKTIANQIRRSGAKNAVVRSVMTCSLPEGICAHCAGLQATGKFPSKGDALGITAGHAISEPIVQGSLNCLLIGTKVRMANGTEKRIEEIAVGEEVLGCNLEGKLFPVRVTATHDQGMQPVQRYSFSATREGKPVLLTVDSTATHPFLFCDSSGQLMKLQAHDVVAMEHKVARVVDGEVKKSEVLPLTGWTHMGQLPCRDISVDHPDELFVLANGLVVKNTKHTGGMAKGAKNFAGFKVINRFLQTPESFEDRAAVAEEDGVVQEIREASQGGKYVIVNGKENYIPPGFEPLVKVGQEVEAGMQLSEGLMDPYDVTRLRGLGEGRRYWVDKLSQILTDSGMRPWRPNLEILSRAALDHVEITDPEARNGVLPGDVVSYNRLQARYQKPSTTQKLPTFKAHGKYLQVPVLHHTIGTRVTPTIAKQLQEQGVNEVEVDDEAPQFRPEMVRLQTAGFHNPDWLAAQHTGYLTDRFTEAAVRGQDTDTSSNVHFVPRLAVGSGFGDNLKETGKF